MNKWVAGLEQTQAAHKIIMEISLLIMEKSWNNHGIWILNFCGNPDSVLFCFIEYEPRCEKTGFLAHLSRRLMVSL